MTWTTPTTRSTGDLITAAIWNQDMVDNVQHLHDRLGVIWQPPTYRSSGSSRTGLTGDWLYGSVNSSGAYQQTLNMVVPDDFDSLVSLDVIVIADAAGTAYWTLTSDYGTDGESSSNHSGALTNQAWAAVTTLTALDVSGAFASIAAGDYLGAVMAKGTTSWVTTSEIQVLGWRMVYNRQ